MKLPSVVRQVGLVNGNSRVYIEDYAYAYLSELKRNQKLLPVKVALYGYAFHKEEISYYVVYGAAVFSEETEKVKVKSEFFSDYEHIGYMKLLKDTLLPGEKEGCFIFCEENTAMQNFLIFAEAQGKQKEKNFLNSSGKKLSGMWRYILQKTVLVLLVTVAAISVSTIDRYHLMREFVIMAAKAIGELG